MRKRIAIFPHGNGNVYALLDIKPNVKDKILETGYLSDCHICDSNTFFNEEYDVNISDEEYKLADDTPLQEWKETEFGLSY